MKKKQREKKVGSDTFWRLLSDSANQSWERKSGLFMIRVKLLLKSEKEKRDWIMFNMYRKIRSYM